MVNHKRIIVFCSVLFYVSLLFPVYCFSEIYFQDDFEYADSLKKHGWRVEGNVELESAGGLSNSGCAKVRYDHKGTSGYWFGHNVSKLKLNDVYVRFYFKRTSWVKGGCKFLKIFGKRNDPEGYANTTFALQYSSGNLVEVSYGSGHAYDNDTQDVISYSGSRITDSNVKVHTAKGAYKVPDNTWVCFEAHVKYNTNGNRDGEYQVWIDGSLWFDAKNVVNRNDVNSQYFNSIEFANYTHQPWSDIWYLWYDNIVMSDSYIGPIDKSSDNIPKELELQNDDRDGRKEHAIKNILFKEDFEDANFASRGWYDNTNIQLSSDEHVSGTSAAEFHFTKGDTKPLSGSAIRKKFTETDEVYVSYFVKYSANWEGSNKRYHPHEFYLLTNVDGNWTGTASTHLTAYIEQNEGAPLLSIQDAQNIDEANIGVDLTHVTENRAVAGCNGDGDCYKAGNAYRNGKQWRADKVYFQDEPGQYYKNDWHFIEAYFKLNTISGGKGVTDGQVKYWYDGKLIIDHNNVIMRTAQHPDIKFNQFLIGPYIGDGSPVDQTFWVDNLTVASSRVSEAIPPEKQATLADNVPAKDSDQEHRLDMVDNDSIRQIESLPRNPEVIYLPQEIDLTKHTIGVFPVKIRVEGIEEQEYWSILPRIRYQMGTGSSYGFFDMAPEGGGVWRYDIPDPNWYNYRSNSLHYQVKLFDEEGTVISESRWEVELIDSFIQKD